MSERRRAVLEALRDSPSDTTINALARRMSLHANTVREHLDALVGAGLARRTALPAQGRGRPAAGYTALDPVAQDVRTRDYAGLATALVGHLARTSPDPEGDGAAAGAEWGRDLARGRACPHSEEGTRREVVALLDELGFAPDGEPGATTVRLRECPLLEAAERYPQVVCSVHLGIVQGAMVEMAGRAEQTDLRPFAEPGACVLHLDATVDRG